MSRDSQQITGKIVGNTMDEDKAGTGDLVLFDVKVGKNETMSVFYPLTDKPLEVLLNKAGKPVENHLTEFAGKMSWRRAAEIRLARATDNDEDTFDEQALIEAVYDESLFGTMVTILSTFDTDDDDEEVESRTLYFSGEKISGFGSTKEAMLAKAKARAEARANA